MQESSVRRFWIIAAVGVLVTGLLAAETAAAAPDQKGGSVEISRVVGVPGLRTVPERPVQSLILRPNVAAHHGVGLQGRPPRCDKDIDTTGHISGFTFVVAQNNVICSSADIDVWQQTVDSTTKSFVVQAGGDEAAFVITEVTTPGTPVGVIFKWTPRRVQRSTFTPDVKAFKQGSHQYIALALERSKLRGACGVVIFDVTNFHSTGNVVFKDQFIGVDWCDSHNVFVETDDFGDGEFIYAVADATDNMRVLDINGNVNVKNTVENPAEIGSYTHPCVDDPTLTSCPPLPTGPGRSPVPGLDFFVHDMTMVKHGENRRVYVSYWDAGLDIVDADTVTPGHTTTALNPKLSIDPAGFLNHHAYPNAAGDVVFIQDEITFSSGFEPVQMWDISELRIPSFVEGLGSAQGKDGELLPAHNLLVTGSELYVGWYKAGLQVFGFTSLGFTNSGDAVAYHQVQTEAVDDPYSGTWGVRHLTIDSTDYVFQSDRFYGLIIDSRL